MVYHLSIHFYNLLPKVSAQFLLAFCLYIFVVAIVKETFFLFWFQVLLVILWRS